MTDQEFYQEEFIVMLTIDGTSYDEIEVKVTDPNKTIRDQINSIVQVFELPKMDNGGNPIQYLLGKLMEDDEEPVILEFEDENGREMYYGPNGEIVYKGGNNSNGDPIYYDADGNVVPNPNNGGKHRGDGGSKTPVVVPTPEPTPTPEPIPYP